MEKSNNSNQMNTGQANPFKKSALTSPMIFLHLIGKGGSLISTLIDCIGS